MISYVPSNKSFVWSENTRRINLGRRVGHNLDRNGADDGTGATAATGIRRRDGSSGSGLRGNSKVCLAGIRG
jgi:hypothetical protein